MAKQYYPRLWGPQRIADLVDAGRLTEEEAEAIMKEDTDDKRGENL